MDEVETKKARYSQVRIVERYHRHHWDRVAYAHREVFVIDTSMLESVENRMTEDALRDLVEVLAIVYASYFVHQKRRSIWV